MSCQWTVLTSFSALDQGRKGALKQELPQKKTSHAKPKKTPSMKVTPALKNIPLSIGSRGARSTPVQKGSLAAVTPCTNGKSTRMLCSALKVDSIPCSRNICWKHNDSALAALAFAH